MAEIQQDSTGSNTKVRSKKRSTKIDMTPMVDLVFLLLTFFILTTSFKKPYVLPIVMPDEVKDTSLLPRKPEKDILNVVLADGDRIYWWIGLTPPVQETDYSSNGIRKVLLKKRTNPRLMVLIKPSDDARFENMVDILDEMEITGISRYAIVELKEDDKAMLKSE